MSFPGPFPISQVRQIAPQDLPFRLHERVTAQVMQVTGTQAVLEINGYPVVARLTSKEQASELLSRRSADFIISQLSPEQITLKFINPSNHAEGKPIQVQFKDLAVDLARNLGLQGTDQETTLIRLALSEHLPITREMVEQLLDIVNSSGIDADSGIRLAVKFRAAGIPVTASSLQMADQFSELELRNAFNDLIQALSDILSTQEKDTSINARVRSTLAQLNSLIPDLSSGSEIIKARLHEQFKLIGKSYEKLLDEQLKGTPGSGQDAFDLFDLAQLAKELRSAGETKAADSLVRFLEQVRQGQFWNIKADGLPVKGSWNEVNFIVQWPVNGQSQNAGVKIKVSFRQEEQRSFIDPGFTNLVLQVDLEPEKEVVFNLSIFHDKVNAEISSPDPEVMGLFKGSLTEFKELLHHLGYSVVQTSVGVKKPIENLPSHSMDGLGVSDCSLNIEV